MKNIKNIVLTTIVCAATASCSFLEVEPQIIVGDSFYKTKSEAMYGLAGVYGVINSEAFYGNYYSCMASNTDDLSYFNRGTTNSFLQIYRFDASTTEIYDMWVKIYQGVKNANAFMEAIVKTDFDKDGRYFNEARFLRAYYHFILAQTWGDVPLRDREIKTNDETQCAATPQYEVLKWVIQEMEGCLDIYNAHPEFEDEDLENAPSRICRTTIEGILARVCLFTAGESVDRGEDDRMEYYRKAMNHAHTVIEGRKHRLNPKYADIFINMISDKYDYEYRESMWEADFMGDRSSAENWSNGRIGDVIGLQNTGSSDYETFNCNFSYAQYDGSLKLWDLYWATDRTTDENKLDGVVNDSRQQWNMPPYNYSGIAEDAKNTTSKGPYGDNSGKTYCVAGVDKTPYAYDGKTTKDSETAAQAIRNCGKYRREVIYEGVKDSKRLYTQINYPILRYADVLLMYAEASNEVNGYNSEAYSCVQQVRERAGIKTRPEADYDTDSFRDLVRNERGRELCFESLRKYDLIRWGQFRTAMNEYGSKWTKDARWSKSGKAPYAASFGNAVQDKHVLLPIPSVELGVNKLLKQTSNW